MFYRTPLILLSIFAINFIPHSIEAEENIVLTPAQAMALAHGRNRTLEASRQQIEAKRQKVQKAGSKFFPTLSIETTAARTEGLEIFRPPLELESQTTKNSFEFGLEAEQIIFSGFKHWYGLKEARAAKKQAEFLLSQEELKLSATVLRKYYTHLLTKEKIVLFQEFYPRAMREKDPSLVLQTQTLETEEKLTALALAHYLGGEPGQRFTLQAAFTLEPIAEDIEQLKNRALARRPDLLEAGAKEEEAEYAYKSYVSDYFPIIELGASYGYSQQKKASNLFKDYDEFWRIHAALKLPVFEGLKTLADVRGAKASLLEQRSTRQALKQTILFEVESSYAAAQMSFEIALSAKKNLEKQRALFKKEGKKADRGTLYATRMQYLQALSILKFARVNLGETVGDLSSY